MYDNSFYLAFWSVGVIILFPVFISWLLYKLLKKEPKKQEKLDIKSLLKNIKHIDSKDSFAKYLDVFKKNYRVFNDAKNMETWYECIRVLASTSYWDTDAVAKFGQELEDLNVENARKIALTISSALKVRDMK